MKKMLVTVALMALITAPAMATTVYAPWSVSNPTDELNLYEIVNALYGTTYGSNTAMQFASLGSNDEVFSGTQAIEAEARYAGFQQTFGWYQFTGSGSPTAMHSLFTVTGTGIGDLGSAIIDPLGSYGFYDAAGPYVWYSERNENSGGEDHMVAYNLEALTQDGQYHGCVLAAWEDKPFACSDRDYQDLVVQFSPVVPEPMTLVLLSMGLGGFALRRRFFA